MSKVVARDGTLSVTFPDGTAAFDLGPAAAKWQDKILHPPSRLAKLGAKREWRVSALGVHDEAFLKELEGAVAYLSIGRVAKASDAIFLGATKEAELGRIGKLKSSLRPDGALWVIRPKGRPEISETGGDAQPARPPAWSTSRSSASRRRTRPRSSSFLCGLGPDLDVGDHPGHRWVRFVDTEPDESCRGPRQSDFNRYRPRIAQRTAHRQSRGALGGDDGPVDAGLGSLDDQLPRIVSPVFSDRHDDRTRARLAPELQRQGVADLLRVYRSSTTSADCDRSARAVAPAPCRRRRMRSPRGRRHTRGLEAAAILRRKTASADPCRAA